MSVKLKKAHDMDLMVGKRAICERFPCGSQIQYVEVIIMAVSGDWAMVRHPRCIPFVCNVGNLVSKQGASA